MLITNNGAHTVWVDGNPVSPAESLRVPCHLKNPLGCPEVESRLARMPPTSAQASDIPGILAHALKPAPVPLPVAAPPASPQGLGVIRQGDHRLGDFSGRLA